MVQAIGSRAHHVGQRYHYAEAAYWVNKNHIFIRTNGVHTVFLAGNSPYLRSNLVSRP